MFNKPHSVRYIEEYSTCTNFEYPHEVDGVTCLCTNQTMLSTKGRWRVCGGGMVVLRRQLVVRFSCLTHGRVGQFRIPAVPAKKPLAAGAVR